MISFKSTSQKTQAMLQAENNQAAVYLRWQGFSELGPLLICWSKAADELREQTTIRLG